MLPNSPAVVYTPHADTNAARELAALSAIYRLALESHTKKKAARRGGPDDGTTVKGDSADAPIIRQERVRHP